MQEGVVIFSQKDVDEGLMSLMEAFARDMEVSVPDMIKQVFARRMADHIAHHDANGYHKKEFWEDKIFAAVGEKGHFTGLVHYLVERIRDAEYDSAEVLQ